MFLRCSSSSAITWGLDTSSISIRITTSLGDLTRSGPFSFVDVHIEGPAIAPVDGLASHDGQWRREARTVGHDRVVLAEFATGIYADGFHATHGLFGQRES